MTFVLEIRPDLKSLMAPIAQLLELTDRLLTSDNRQSVTYAEIERSVEEHLGAIERGIHEQLLKQLDVDAPRVTIRGKPHRRVGRYNGTYRTKAGPVKVERTLYRPLGDRNAKTVDAVRLRAGVVEDGWLPGAARAMAHMIANVPSREAEAMSRELGRLPYSRCSFERVGHAVGRRYDERHVELEEALIKQYDVPDEACTIQVSLDRTTVPMEEPVEQPETTPPSAEVLEAFGSRPGWNRTELNPRIKAQYEDAKRASEPGVQRAYRMAYCATVSLHDARGEPLHIIRYGRMPKGDLRSSCKRLTADVRAFREHRLYSARRRPCGGPLPIFVGPRVRGRGFLDRQFDLLNRLTARSLPRSPRTPHRPTRASPSKATTTATPRLLRRCMTPRSYQTTGARPHTHA